MLKKILTIFIICLFFSVNVITLSAEDENEKNQEMFSIKYSFSQPKIKSYKDNDIIYHSIEITGLSNSKYTEKYSLPAKGAYILLPQNSQLNNIDIIWTEKVNLGFGYNIKPDTKNLPYKKTYNEVDKSNISKEKTFQNLYTKIGINNFRGYQILVLKLNPIHYNPSTGELYYFPDMTVKIETKQNLANNKLFRGVINDELQVLDKVDNPKMISSYKTGLDTIRSGNGVDYVIITTESFKNKLQELAQEHEKNGISTEIVTTNHIYSTYNGEDDADKIRNYIKSAYSNDGIEYVLLAGDTDIIPYKSLGANIETWYGYSKIPSDLYYGCLNGKWNKPEEADPISKDFSIDSSNFDASGYGFLDNPIKDSTEHIVGSDSLKFNVFDKSKNKAFVNLTFKSSIDLTNKNWFNFYSKSIKSSEYVVFTLHSVNFYCEDGRQICKRLYNTWSNGTYIYSDWDFCPIAIPKGQNFDYSAVNKISLKIQKGPHIKNNDKLFIDGIYCSKWIDDWLGEPDEIDDLIPDVYIGRASASNSNEINIFVDKTLKYLQMDKYDPYFYKVLLVGERLGHGGIAEYGGNFKDEVINRCNNHGMNTKGFSEDNFVIDKLYDKDHGGYSGWKKSLLIEKINNNVHIINHLGHANYGVNMKINKSNIPQLKNEKPCFIYSMGCNAGGFHKDDCIAEYFTVKTNNGAFAGIWNSRYGWGGGEDTTDGPSQRYDREFWDAVFGENINVISKANADSKYDNLYRINDKYMRWIYLGLNLLGDPALSFVINDNNKPEKPSKISGPTQGKPDESYEFSFVSSDPDLEDIYYFIDWGDGQDSNWIGPYESGEEIIVSHSWSDKQNFNIKVKVRDQRGLESDSLVFSFSTPRYRLINEITNYKIINFLLLFFKTLQI